jgi:hypothetical protein
MKKVGAVLQLTACFAVGCLAPLMLFEHNIHQQCMSLQTKVLKAWHTPKQALTSVMQHLSHATQLGRLCTRLGPTEVSALHLCISHHWSCHLSLVAAAVACCPVLRCLDG